MRKYVKTVITTIVGAGIGYAWYYYYGCENACAITSSGTQMTAIGAIFGLIFGFPTSSKKEQEINNEADDNTSK